MQSVPRLVRFLLFHALCGMVAAGALTFGIVATDTAGMGTLVANSPDGIMAVVMMFAGLTVTLGSFAMGIAVMRLAGDDDRQDKGLGAILRDFLVTPARPAPLEARIPARSRSAARLQDAARRAREADEDLI